MKNRINIAKDFSRLPGPRYISEGANSGEEFRERILRPKFIDAVAARETLNVELDGVTFGYPTSFLEEAFGGLARELGSAVVLQNIVFTSVDEPMLRAEIERYIKDASKTSRERAAQASHL